MAGLTLVLLMFALSFTVATAQEVVTRMADVGAAVVKRWGGRVMIGVGLWLVVLAVGANVFARFFPVHPEAQGQMPGMGASGNPTPPVKGFAKGQEVLFIHTEASDAQVAEMLTRMMGPKVLVVPSLARIPRDLLGNVYVFRNGVRGAGPFGFQPDVFDSAPPGPDYTPLRRVTFVKWNPGPKARVLTSVTEIKASQAVGQLAVTPSIVVVNMPMLTWPGGQR